MSGTGHSWLHDFLLWDCYYALALSITIGAVVMDSGASVGERAVAVAALLLVAAWYLGFGRPLMRADDESWRGLVYAGVALPLFVVAVALSPPSSFALLALIPQAYWCLSTLPATGVVVAYCAAVVGVDAVRSGDLGRQVANEGPSMLLLIVFALVVGGWSHRIIRQSRERATLIEELDSTRAQLAVVSHQAGIDAERQRMATEIHDTLAQGLSSIVMLVEAADTALDDRALTAAPRVEQARRHLASAARTARENLAEARAMVGALSPAPLAAGSVSDAVSRLVTRFGEDAEVRASYTQHGSPVRLEPAAEVVLLRAAQEALANVGKHAGPTTVDVSLRYDDAAVVLSVRDDGVGFDPARPTGGYGLSGMRDRVEQVGGTCTIDSRVGAGTTVTAQVPR